LARHHSPERRGRGHSTHPRPTPRLASRYG
jgi:hypothetical protein